MPATPQSSATPQSPATPESPHSTPRAHSSRTLANLTVTLIAGALLLLVSACGVGFSESVETASPIDDATLFAAVPAVPTTAPILLPPEDTSLPALAPIPTTAPVVVVDEQIPLATAPTAPSVPVPVEAETAPAAAAEAPAAPSTAAPVEAESAAVVPVAVASVDWWNPCVVSAAQSVGASALLDPIASATTTDLSSVQLNELAVAAAPCGVVSEALTASALGAHLGSSASCMNEWLASSGGGAVFTGLASISFGQATPAWAQSHLVASIESCFSGASFAAQVMADVATDATLTAAFDASCLASSFESSNTLAGFAQWIATDPVNASLSISMSDGWVMSCANLGRVVASAAAAEGVALSGSTVACLDAELTSSGLGSQLLAGTADSDAVGIATIGCLSNDEAAALLG